MTIWIYHLNNQPAVELQSHQNTKGKTTDGGGDGDGKGHEDSGGDGEGNEMTNRTQSERARYHYFFSRDLM